MQKKSSSPNEPNQSEVSLEAFNLRDDLADYSELFVGDDVKVRLIRLSPDVFNGVPCAGFICYLKPGDDLSTIEQKYGGGRYKLARVVDGKWDRQVCIDICGNPKIQSGAAGAAPGAAPGGFSPDLSPGGGTYLHSDADIDGIPLGGSDKEFFARIERVKLIREAFPEPKDVNADLLAVVLKNMQNGSSLLDQAGKIADLITAFKGMAAGTPEGGGTGAGLLDIARDFMRIIAERKGPSPLPNENNPNLPVEDSQSHKTNLELPPMAEKSSLSLAQTAVNAAVEAYILKPSMPPDEAAEVIIALLPVYNSLIAQTVQNSLPVITNLARISFNQYCESVDDMDFAESWPEFYKYFNQVITCFINHKSGESHGSN